MHVVEFNDSSLFKLKSVFCFIAPVMFISRFVTSKFYPISFFISNLKVSIILDERRRRKVLPEIIFWFLIVLLRRFGLVTLFNKKAYLSGQAVYSKNYSSIISSTYKCFKNVFFLKSLFIYLCKKGRILNTYWFRFSKTTGFTYNFTFTDIIFDERFNRLVNVAPFYWSDMKIILHIFIRVYSILHVSFFFREFIKMPFDNIKLRERRVDF